MMRSSLLAVGCWGGGKRAQIEGDAPQIEGGESCQGLPNAQKPLLAEANLPTVGSWAMLVRPCWSDSCSHLSHPPQTGDLLLDEVSGPHPMRCVNQLQLAKTELHP